MSRICVGVVCDDEFSHRNPAKIPQSWDLQCVAGVCAVRCVAGVCCVRIQIHNLARMPNLYNLPELSSSQVSAELLPC